MSIVVLPSTVVGNRVHFQFELEMEHLHTRDELSTLNYRKALPSESVPSSYVH